MDERYYQLEEALVQGFHNQEEYQNYQALKESYEEDTGDMTFTKRELTNQLEILLQESNDLDEVAKAECLEWIEKLEEYDYSEANYYRGLLAVC